MTPFQDSVLSSVGVRIAPKSEAMSVIERQARERIRFLLSMLIQEEKERIRQENNKMMSWALANLSSKADPIIELSSDSEGDSNVAPPVKQEESATKPAKRKTTL